MIECREVKNDGLRSELPGGFVTESSWGTK